MASMVSSLFFSIPSTMGSSVRLWVSPAIVNEYDGKIPLFHFDMYRLGDEDGLFDIGWEDYLNRGGVCAVEWSERIAGALPPETIKVTISRCSGNDDWPQPPGEAPGKRSLPRAQAPPAGDHGPGEQADGEGFAYTIEGAEDK